jgi:DNA adenine methylase
MDFEKVIEKYDSESTYIYLDPPYWKTENYYSNHDFDRNDHERLANVLKNVKGKFSLSIMISLFFQNGSQKINIGGNQKNLQRLLLQRRV